LKEERKGIPGEIDGFPSLYCSFFLQVANMAVNTVFWKDIPREQPIILLIMILMEEI